MKGEYDDIIIGSPLGRFLKRLNNPLIVRIREIIFYLALTVEVMLVIADKSNYLFPWPSYVFRLTFVLFFAAVLLGINRFDRQGLTLFVLLIILGGVDYFFSGRNELLRFFMFMGAMAGIDHIRAVKVFFWESLAGSLAIMALSVTGIYGGISNISGDGLVRYCFGMGDANAFHCMLMAILLMGLYLYYRQMKWYHFILMFAGNIVFYLLTGCDSAMAVTAMAVAAFALIRYSKAGESRIPYLIGALLYIFSIAFSVWSAIVSKYTWREDHPIEQLADRILTGRIKNLYWNWDAHPGAIESWKLIAGRDTEYYFDMGWCRLVYWYGMIPAAVICILIVIIFIRVMMQRDAAALILITLISIYTITEAHFVSVYIGRNFLLPIGTAYLLAYWKAKESSADT